jgi:hypothetical protein
MRLAVGIMFARGSLAIFEVAGNVDIGEKNIGLVSLAFDTSIAVTNIFESSTPTLPNKVQPFEDLRPCLWCLYISGNKSELGERGANT